MKGQGIFMKFLNKLQRKFGKYAIPNIMYYVIVIQIAGIFLGFFAPELRQYLTLNVNAIMNGQVWRLVTFVMTGYMGVQGVDLLFAALELYIYYSFSQTLENIWGTFRFNLYFLSGILFNIVAAFILYFVYSVGMGIYVIPDPYAMKYVFETLLLAFALTFPDTQLLLWFIIPLKVKYFAYLFGFFFVTNIAQYIMYGNIAAAVAMIASMANFLIFFFATRNYKKYSPNRMKRKIQYTKEVQNATSTTRHKCAVCGRTELDGDHLEFRYCSKCDGNYEYCMEHLFTHEHVRKDNKK